MGTEKITANRFFRYRWIMVFIAPLVLFITMELALSVVQLFRWKKDIKPYHVTPFLRPIARVFIHDDFYPRTHHMYGVPWDYKTDRMRPGHYPSKDGLPPYTINSYGIRGEEFAIPKPKDIFRIVVFGGSTTFGADNTDNETYPALLEKNLITVASKKVEVLNYGMPSKSMYYIAKHYFDEVDILQPDLVIINNIRNTTFYDGNIRVVNYSDILTPERYYIFKCYHFMKDNSLVFRMLNRLYQNSKKKPTNYNYHFYNKVYYDTIESIYKDTYRRGIRLMFIYEPMYSNPQQQLYSKTLTYDKLWQTPLDRFVLLAAVLYANIEKLQKEYPDVLILDPIERFIQEQDKHLDDQVFTDYLHLAPKGNKLLAEMITDMLVREVSFD